MIVISYFTWMYTKFMIFTFQNIQSSENDIYKKEEGDYYLYHSLNWLKTAKTIGGSEIILDDKTNS